MVVVVVYQAWRCVLSVFILSWLFSFDCHVWINGSMDQWITGSLDHWITGHRFGKGENYWVYAFSAHSIYLILNFFGGF